ncbi:MAG: hypothetical protein ACFE9C_07180 [Candidatus Hodarchaeota archaeon]
MSERSEIEEVLIKRSKLSDLETRESEILYIDKVVQEYAPEIAYLYHIREDEAEEQQIKTGRLHENRILGIVLKYYLEGKNRITTGEVEREYKTYFKEIARSTTSTYLNMLKKEATLYTERDGRVAYYIFYEDPPVDISPFWFSRIFCIVPAYFNRATRFSSLYFEAEKFVQQYINDYGDKDKELLIRNFKFIIGLLVLKILKNRCSKCINCQFSKRDIYKKLEEMINLAINDRTDVLPGDLIVHLIDKHSEIPIFNGTDIKEDDTLEKIIREIVRSADIFKKDLDFQIMVSTRRKDSRLKQIKALEENTSKISD